MRGLPALPRGVPLLAGAKGADAARFGFTELGADIRIAAPKDAVSAGANG